MLDRFVAGVAVAVLAAAPAMAWQEWDQRTVNAVAADLAVAARTLKGTLASEPALAEAGTPEGDAARFAESVDVLGKVARRLARALGDNMDLEETLPLATDIRTSADEAGHYGRQVMDADWMDEHVAPVQELAARLAAYYFD